MTITGDWEAVPVRWAQKDSSSGSRGSKNTEQPVVCRGRWDPMAGPCFSVQLGSEDGDVCRHGLGLEERKIKGTACVLSRSGCTGLAGSRKGRKDEAGAGGTHLKPLTRSQGRLHSLPSAAPHAVNLSTPLPTQGHNQSLLPPAQYPLSVGLFPCGADNTGSQ